jgi:hypothetical protein
MENLSIVSMVEETEHQFHAELQKQRIQRDLHSDI